MKFKKIAHKVPQPNSLCHDIATASSPSPSLNAAILKYTPDTDAH